MTSSPPLITRLADLDISLARIEEATAAISPQFKHTPQFVDDPLSSALGRQVIVKVETANPLRSFKGRGADFGIGRLVGGRDVASSSTRNYRQAIAYFGRCQRCEMCWVVS